ncbi:MAG TPA: hypothetical protein VGQ36_02285 [Thermoanaerobaculia bacterium]|jgi:hypothetical protein|nr:hypothetical protein [Thermoanaerobaculia bacterium]
MKTLLRTLLVLTLALAAFGATTNNDDSCDIAVLPAATLLLPYFEVDLDDPSGETTIFTVTNTTNLDAIAHVTLWTDRGFPVIDFNIYLTGYDVQPLNLYDIIERGIIAPDAGTGTAIVKRGTFADANPSLDLRACDRLPGQLDDAYVVRMQSAFTEGSVPDLGILKGCADIGDEHGNAVGYLTIDVVGLCSTTLPTEPEYWTNDIRYDNVLIGDYQQINSRENFAQGGPLVHIRAIPEGGTPDQRRASPITHDAGFARTFYARYQSPLSPKLDGRQPLPSQFAVRWIQGGTGSFETSLKVWREARVGIDASCEDYAADESLAVHEIVTFDENENAVGSGDERFELAATSRTSIDDADVYPQLANGASAGWMYLNLDRGRHDDDVASQSWVISSMRAEGRYSTDFDAIAMGNGCSAPAPTSEVDLASGARIAPAPNESTLHGVASTNNDDSCDIALLPAATLLLPYFEVDLDDPQGETTLFTVTNVSPNDQIARVTLWTDYAFPAITFNLYLTGYDVQSINLYDVIERGLIAPGAGRGTHVTNRGAYSDRNRSLDLSACAQLPGPLTDAYVVRMQSAFTVGTVPDFGALAGCNNVGNVHDNAVGYATIDLVRNCSTNNPFSEEYWTEDLAYDNVLIGDHHQVHSANNFAQGSPMVHIRAVPEGATLAARRELPRKYDAGFERTFYARYQPALWPKLDGRQPLPSVFAARWIQGGASDFQTELKIWREGLHGRDATCAANDENVLALAEFVRFDEAENAVGDTGRGFVRPGVGTNRPGFFPTETTLAATTRTSVADASIYPQLNNGAVAGWMYVNLDNDSRTFFGDIDFIQPWASQNWIVSSMRAEGRYSVDMDAAALGNGCSSQAPISETTSGSSIIGPRPNVKP